MQIQKVNYQTNRNNYQAQNVAQKPNSQPAFGTEFIVNLNDIKGAKKVQKFIDKVYSEIGEGLFEVKYRDGKKWVKNEVFVGLVGHGRVPNKMHIATGATYDLLPDFDVAEKNQRILTEQGKKIITLKKEKVDIPIYKKLLSIISDFNLRSMPLMTDANGEMLNNSGRITKSKDASFVKINDFLLNIHSFLIDRKGKYGYISTTYY